MSTQTTNVSFVKLYKEQSKRQTTQWLGNDNDVIKTVTVYATDSNYQNGKLIPDADVSILNRSSDGSIGFQYEFPIPFDDKGELQPFDFYFQIVSTLEDGNQVTYNTHSYYKPDGNPGSEGDSTKPIKP
ncbi:MAG: hypothetical protein U0X41_10435 [Chitinophagales bacterium]|jgi:hypothetical protein